MASLQKRRAALRSVFTKEANSLRESLGSDDVSPTELKARLQTLTNRYSKLASADEEILATLGNEDEQDGKQIEEILEAELTVCGEYELTFQRLNEDITHRLMTTSDNSMVSAVEDSKSPTRVLKLRRPDIKKFGGEIKYWISFWAQFSKIDEDVSLQDEDKFAFLLEALVPGSPAQKLVEGFPPSRENYRKAIELLKARYGKEELLIEYYVRELLSLVLRRAENTVSQLYDQLEAQLRALDSLGVTKEKYAAMIFPLVESSVPENVFKVWERHRIGKNASIMDAEGCLTELLSFLRIEVEGEERLKLRQNTFEDHAKTRGSSQAQKTVKPQKIPSAAALVSTDSPSKITACIFCEKGHSSSECTKAIDMTMEERNALLKRKGACFKCLKPGHMSGNCRAFLKCLCCKGRHFPIMCPKINMEAVEPGDSRGKLGPDKMEAKALVAGYQTIKTVYLQTLVAKLVVNEQEIPVRILIDSGSQKSYILKSKAKDCKLRRQGKILVQQELFGGQKSALKSHAVYKVLLKSFTGSFQSEFEVLDQEKICGFVPKITDADLYEALKEKGVILTDYSTNVNGSEEIDILLGADAWPYIMTSSIIRFEDDLVAINTKLGWSVIGASKGKSGVSSALIVTLLTQAHLQNFWELETLGIKDPSIKKTQAERDNEVQAFFEKTVARNKDGRYVVRLPWVEGHQELKSNEEIARKRLLATTKKLQNLGRYEDYDCVIKDWLRNGIVERVPNNELDDDGHWLPHRAVFKENSTTKVRPVFDASNQDENGRSLNNSLEKGPNQIEMIPTVINNFRQFPIGVSADIERAFLQIEVAEIDRNWLRFLWWENGKMISYRHCRVVFGVSSSPYLLGAVLRLHLKAAPVHLKETAEKLNRSFYVDNSLTGVENEEELANFIDESQQILSSAGFNLRGWVSNVDSEKQEVNILGLHWDCKDDTLACNSKLIEGVPASLSRRMLLSMAHRLYDPLGFTEPAKLIPRLILQKSYDLKSGWDDPLTPELAGTFKDWLSEIHFISKIKIPRRIFLNTTSTIHVFSDASKSAFAACMFIRTEWEGEIKTCLLMAKTRVAPKDGTTLPRLELLGALIGVRLYLLARQSLNCGIKSVYFWIDSSVALAWITHKQRWSVFVENRVKEIRESTNPEQWHHIPGVNNPADLLSRGCSPSKLLESRWWEGPKWLRLPEVDWPRSEVSPPMDQVLQEKRKTVVAAEVIVAPSFSLNDLAERFSSYKKIVNTVARILDAICILCPAFTNHCGLTSEMILDRSISSEKFLNAETMIVRAIQKEVFSNDAGKKTIRGLKTYYDERGILHLKTRILEEDNSQEFTYPILLPSKHPLVRRMIEYEHVKRKHAGAGTLIMILREKYWILQTRRAVNKVTKNCLICRKNRAQALEVPIPPLPRDRTKVCPTFHTTGIDLAGPLFLSTGEKCWVVLFTCAVYRAVYLDIVTSLSSAALIQTMRRFFSRRGRPSVIHSDNGTNFVGLENSLAGLDWAKIQEECGIQRVKWKFNPPGAPWWGGYWERLIRLLKNLLKKNLGRARLNLEELLTLLCEIEFLMNDRPLTYICEDPSQLVPLKPNMFLTSLPSGEVDDLDALDSTSLQTRWKYMQRLRQGLRSRFHKEYLGFLMSTRRKTKDATVQVDEIVLIGNEKKRLDWQLARVLEVIPGRDGIIRVAKLKTKNGVITRPVQRLYPLEVGGMQSEDDVNLTSAAPTAS